MTRLLPSSAMRMWPFFEQLGAVRVVQLVGPASGDAGLAVLPEDLLGHVDHDDAGVRLVGDEDAAAGKVGRLHRRVQAVEPGPGDPGLAVLPDDLAGPVDEQHAAVGRAACGIAGDARRGTGAGDERKAAGDALRVVGSDHGPGPGDERAGAEVPDDVSVPGHLDDAVVELVGDQHVALLVEARGGGAGRYDGSQPEGSKRDEDACQDQRQQAAALTGARYSSHDCSSTIDCWCGYAGRRRTARPARWSLLSTAPRVLSRCGSSPARSAAAGRRGTSRGRARGAPAPRRPPRSRRRRAAACTRPRPTP